MNRAFILISLVLSVSISAFSQTKLFIEPEFYTYGGDHKIIAILPFKTTISLRPKQMSSLKKGQLEKLQENESASIQQSMYSWFLKRKQQGKMWVDVQDVNTTNAMLSRSEITYKNLDKLTPAEIAQILQVDAVIKGTFETNTPMSEGAAVALGWLFGFYGPTNEATLNLFIYNATDGKVLVNYNKRVTGAIGSSSEELINIVMRKASRRIPYTKPKK
ncbi:MAG: hypothetical protein AAF789_11175 [Bacteroidota bacterium]